MQPKVVAPGDGEAVKHFGWEAVIKLTGADTAGAMTVIETRHSAGKGASAHVHSRESETFILLEGSCTFRVGDQRIAGAPGTLVFGPPGTAHGFEVGTPGARLLHIFAPAGMEGFFRAPRGLRMTDEAFAALRREYGVETVDQ